MKIASLTFTRLLYKMAETLVITKQLAVQAGLLAAVSRPSFKLSSHTLTNSEEPPIFRPKTLDNQEFCKYTCCIETFQYSKYLYIYPLCSRIFTEEPSFRICHQMVEQSFQFLLSTFSQGRAILTNRRGHERTMRMFGGSRLSCSHTAAYFDPPTTIAEGFFSAYD